MARYRFDADTALRITEKVIEMIDRVKIVDKFLPGAVAECVIEVAGERFKISLCRQPHRHDTRADSDGDDGA